MDSKHFQFHFYCLPDASKLNDTMRKIVLALILTIVYACNSDDENVDPCTQFDAVVQTISLPSACDARDASVTFETIGGRSPYNYQLNTGSRIISQSLGDFQGLFPGNFTIEVIDLNNCNVSFEFSIGSPDQSEISYATEIVAILQSKCTLPACHNGDLGADNDWRSYDVIQDKLNNFQRVVYEERMPPVNNEALTDEEKSDLLLSLIHI